MEKIGKSFPPFFPLCPMPSLAFRQRLPIAGVLVYVLSRFSYPVKCRVVASVFFVVRVAVARRTSSFYPIGWIPFSFFFSSAPDFIYLWVRVVLDLDVFCRSIPLSHSSFLLVRIASSKGLLDCSL